MRIIVIAPISATNGAKQTTDRALALIKTLKELHLSQHSPPPPPDEPGSIADTRVALSDKVYPKFAT